MKAYTRYLLSVLVSGIAVLFVAYVFTSILQKEVANTKERNSLIQVKMTKLEISCANINRIDERLRRMDVSGACEIDEDCVFVPGSCGKVAPVEQAKVLGKEYHELARLREENECPSTLICDFGLGNPVPKCRNNRCGYENLGLIDGPPKSEGFLNSDI
jgi:hypothetical protein